MLAAVAFAVLPVRIKELVYGNIQQGDNFISSILLSIRILAEVRRRIYNFSWELHIGTT